MSATQRKRTVDRGLTRVESRTGIGATFQARVYLGDGKRLTRHFADEQAAREWRRRELAALARRRAQHGTPPQRSAADAYSAARKAAQTVDAALRLATGRARRDLEAALDALYVAEDAIGDALRR